VGYRIENSRVHLRPQTRIRQGEPVMENARHRRSWGSHTTLARRTASSYM